MGDILIVGALILILCWVRWMGMRHTRVWIFIHYLYQLAWDYHNRHRSEIAAGIEQDPAEWFLSEAPGYFEMLFSGKPLSLGAWFDPALVKKIKS